MLNTGDIIASDKLTVPFTSCVNQVIASLRESGADRFDPVRFRYVEAMSRRASMQRHAVSKILEKKLLKALDEYQNDFVKARENAAVVVGRVASQREDEAERVHLLFEGGDFKAVQRMESSLQRNQKQRALTALTERFGMDGATLAEAKELSFDDFVQRQEDDVVQSFIDSASASDSQLSGVFLNEGKLTESKSIRRFRESLLKKGSDKRVTQSINDGPENPGPLNSQKLVIRSLSAMRNLSPDYLNRFIAYIDTLLWLEDAGKSVESAAGKKVANKSKRKGIRRK